MPGSTLPNVITVARILACPAVFLLALSPGLTARFLAFVLFLVAAISDLFDGWLARRHGWVTDMGKLLDPLADKLLLVATLIPFYIISHRPGDAGEVPWWGELPLWVLVILLGRELFITLFRTWASRRGVIIAAGASGKHKSTMQMIFSGALLFWYPLLELAGERGWSGALWDAWMAFHGAVIGVTLLLALILTVYSMIDYLWSYRSLVGVRD